MADRRGVGNLCRLHEEEQNKERFPQCLGVYWYREKCTSICDADAGVDEWPRAEEARMAFQARLQSLFEASGHTSSLGPRTAMPVGGILPELVEDEDGLKVEFKWVARVVKTEHSWGYEGGAGRSTLLLPFRECTCSITFPSNS